MVIGGSICYTLVTDSVYKRLMFAFSSIAYIKTSYFKHLKGKVFHDRTSSIIVNKKKISDVIKKRKLISAAKAAILGIRPVLLVGVEIACSMRVGSTMNCYCL